MTKLANELKSETGYGLKDRLLNLLMNLMAKYEIPHETAYSYAHGILYTILDQIQEITPEKYDRYFQEEWRKEQAEALEEISAKIDRVDKELAECRERQIEIYSADEMDIRLKRSTVNPQIGVDYFFIDDEPFKALFSEYRSRECVYIKARCWEEAIYCIINELWNLNDNRAIFVVQSKEDWERLHHISASGNIYIPWFYADEITAIKDNTNIFVLSDELPAFSNDVIELRPRMPEGEVLLYEELLSEIHTVQPEYEYEYLFRTDGKYPILRPIPYDREGKREENNKIVQNLISEKLKEFQSLNLDLKILAYICGQAKSTTLGRNLALYWKNAEYDRNTFITLINSQKSGVMALDYYQGFALKAAVSFEEVLKTANSLKCSDEFIAGLYRVEACYAKNIPKVDSAGENIKRLFWMNPWIHIGDHYEWALSECKRFGTIDSFLKLLYRIREQHNLNNEKVYNYLLEIKMLKPGTDILNIEFYISELLKPVQAEYLSDSDKCMKIAEIELIFSNVINWENMECFQAEIKSSPDLYAEMVSIIYKKENDELENRELTEREHNYISNIHRVFDKAKFCPAEINGEVNEEELKRWIERLVLLLKKNKQSGLLGFLLGRILSFSPVGRDNHRPCEAVREMIEIYADDSLISEYQVSVFNARGMHSPSAGKEELRIAEKFKENAEYLSVKYPRTAEIYYGLYRSYKEDSDSERERAENGWYF